MEIPIEVLYWKQGQLGWVWMVLVNEGQSGLWFSFETVTHDTAFFGTQ